MALGVRLFSLGSNPVEVHADELAGLVGVSNVLHGRAPLVPFFDLRVEYLPLYGVLESVSTAIFGVNAFAMRLPAVLLGVVSVVVLRWLVFELADSPALADGAAALFAVLPWAIDISRLGWENAAVFPFLLGGLASLARGLRRNEGRPLLLAGVLFGIGAYSYRAEPFDGVLLAGALLAAHPRCSLALLRSVLLGCALFALLVTPLAVGVTTHPHFFWRDANIATFGHGYTYSASATFVRNYLAHFAPGPLFAYGDGILDHGPHYGVLYWWMLPFVVGGLVGAPRLIGRRTAAFLYVWLIVYPLGGALTNDGVPDFPRTMIGAPLAAVLTAVGVRAVWLTLADWGVSLQARRAAALAFAVSAAFAFADFMRAYFGVYPAQAADEFKYGTADLFAQVRALARGERRVCFVSLDWYNYDTFVDFYMNGSSLEPIEGLSEPCSLPGSLIVVDAPSKAPPQAKLVAVTPNYEGGVMAYIYRT